MPPVARVSDSIAHTPAMNWLLKGVIIGAGAALLGLVVIGTGGLGAVGIAAVIGGSAALGGGIGEYLASLSFAPQVISGAIASGSPNVFANHRPLAAAMLSGVICNQHGLGVIAKGSSNVFVNWMPLARVGDLTTCSATIASGSADVLAGGGAVFGPGLSDADISPEVPTWANILLGGVGFVSTAILAGPLVAILGAVGSFFGGSAGSTIGGRWFGEGSDGQKTSAFVGSILGGVLAGGGAEALFRETPGTADPSSLVRDGRVNFDDVQEWAERNGAEGAEGTKNKWRPDVDRFPDGGFKYFGEDDVYKYEVHGHGLDPEAPEDSYSRENPTTTIKRRPISGGGRTYLHPDGSWNKYEPASAHLPLDESPFE